MDPARNRNLALSSSALAVAIVELPVELKSGGNSDRCCRFDASRKSIFPPLRPGVAWGVRRSDDRFGSACSRACYRDEKGR